MADLNFPQNPTPGTVWTIGTRSWIWNGSGWALQSGIVSTNPFIVVSAQITTSTNSTSTNSGALIVAGGAGFGGNIYAKDIFSNGSSVITTGTIGSFGVSSITAGTDTAIYIGGGNAYTIWNTSTLQSITNRGAITNNALQLTNTTSSTSTNSGALTVAGSVGVGSNLNVGGNIKGTFLDNYVIITQNNGTLTTSTGLQYTGTDSRLTVSGVIASGGNILENNVRVLTNVVPTAGTAISITSVSTSNGTMAFTINNQGVTSLAGTTYLGISAVSGAVTLSNLGVQTLTAGTDTAVSASTGTITVWSTSTLQSITNRGASTDNTVSISNTAGSTTTTGGALTVSGGVGIGQNLNIGGTLNVWGAATFSSPVTFSGTATYVYSTNTYYTDNLLELHTTSTGINTEWTFDDGKDIGLRFHYYNRALTTGTNAALVLASDSQLLEFYSSGAESNTGTFASGVYGGFKTGLVELTGTGATASATAVGQQSLTVDANGIGVTGDSYFANGLGIGAQATFASAKVTNNFTASGISTLNGAVTANSTLGVVGNFNVTGTSLLSGNVTAAGNFGVIGNANITGTTTLVGVVNATNGTSSAGTNTGAVVITGGLGVGENVNVGGNLFVQGVINATVVGSISTATNLTAGSSGSIPYQTAFGRTSFFGPGTAGDLLVSNGGGSPSFVNTLTLAGTTQASNTLSGTLQVRGGVGIGKDLWVGGDIYTLGQQVITTSTVNNYSNQTAVYAGTDTAVSTSTGNITVWSTSTLQSITNRGATTNNAISITNNNNSADTGTGALIVTGGVAVVGNLNVSGNVKLSGTATTISNATITSLTVNGAGTALTVSSNAQFTGVTTASTFNVSGTATIPTISGNTYFANNANVQGNVNVTGTTTLSVVTATTANVLGNLTVVGTSTLANPVLIGPVAQYISFVSALTTTNATITLDSFPMTDYQTAKYLVQVEDRGFTPRKVHVEEMVLFHDDNGPSTLVYLSSYAISSNQGELGTFDVDYVAGQIILTFTPSYTPTQLRVKTVRTAIMS
jgi:hypothetical protein